MLLLLAKPRDQRNTEAYDAGNYRKRVDDALVVIAGGQNRHGSTNDRKTQKCQYAIVHFALVRRNSLMSRSVIIFEKPSPRRYKPQANITPTDIATGILMKLIYVWHFTVARKIKGRRCGPLHLKTIWCACAPDCFLLPEAWAVTRAEGVKVVVSQRSRASVLDVVTATDQRHEVS